MHDLWFQTQPIYVPTCQPRGRRGPTQTVRPAYGTGPACFCGVTLITPKAACCSVSDTGTGIVTGCSHRSTWATCGPPAPSCCKKSARQVAAAGTAADGVGTGCVAAAGAVGVVGVVGATGVAVCCSVLQYVAVCCSVSIYQPARVF